MRIIFCGGGTMGPVTPLLATIEKIKELNPSVVPIWVGTTSGVERGVVERLGIKYFGISAAKLRRYFDLRSFLVPFVAAAGVFQSIFILLKIQPKAVVVSGSYIQVPVVMVSRLLGIPVIMLQLDVEVGVANRVSSYDANVIVSVLETGTQFGKKSVKVIGAPVRKIISDLTEPTTRAIFRAQAFKRWGFDENKPTILVLGGGTGALGINERIVRNVDELTAQANIINLVGRGKLIKTEPRKNYIALEFLNEEMAEAYAIADLVVSRSGLGTISELGILGLPVVLVPLLGHQEKNAAYLLSKGAAVVVDNTETDQVFVSTVLRLLNDRDRRLSLGRAISEIFPSNGAESFAKVILENTKN